MKLLWNCVFLICLVIITSCSNPKRNKDRDKYLFYLHGGVVTILGDNAINQSMPEWGPYEYSNILDSLRKHGFQVISEMRREEVEDSVYADKIVDQIDSLNRLGVKDEQMALVGASAGWNIALLVSSKLQNPNMKYVMMGGCWPNTHEGYTHLPLKGHFLSVIEATDPHGTCDKIFNDRGGISSYREVKLNTGLSHGFIYKGYKEWIDPIVKWFEIHN